MSYRPGERPAALATVRAALYVPRKALAQQVEFLVASLALTLQVSDLFIASYCLTA